MRLQVKVNVPLDIGMCLECPLLKLKGAEYENK